MNGSKARVVLMFRCVHLAGVLFASSLALPVADYDGWCASWGDVGDSYYEHVARTKGFWVVDGVRVKLTHRVTREAVIEGHEIGGSAADVGGVGE